MLFFLLWGGNFLKFIPSLTFQAHKQQDFTVVVVNPTCQSPSSHHSQSETGFVDANGGCAQEKTDPTKLHVFTLCLLDREDRAPLC